MKKNKVVILIGICVILIVFFISQKDIAPELRLILSEEIISEGGLGAEDEFIDIDSEAIYTDSNAETFPAVVRSSGEKPVETEYTGIELKYFLEEYNFTIKNEDRITFNASDGYRIILLGEEINEPRNVYLVFKRDGELLKSKNRGGKGPYQIVIRHDPFSQRWIKHVDEIIIE